ncbi:ankyrin repeat-containing domain protein [Aspergillus heterothallicus]
MTSLHYAAHDDQIAIVTTLLSHSANPNVSEDEMWPSLHFATESGSVDMVRLLVAHGAGLKRRANSSSDTPLTVAVKLGKRDVTAALLEFAGVELRDLNRPSRSLSPEILGFRDIYMQIVSYHS